ncbi:hypothetical protein IE077_001617 [Cardiosporidium cionae]|uniref:WW domain-containing protein n=1 Tax=Cardiosporidium cionae TaxID=476202 RepID=A0ABQ7JDN7_9APIC|nr:hypothetical protein IE077_001617 [Cardiosporidium cionae]|eukprot:KAF8821755.1 hypothetical protein IE077_001617 [Cardiosporidium cionae]
MAERGKSLQSKNSVDRQLMPPPTSLPLPLLLKRKTKKASEEEDEHLSALCSPSSASTSLAHSKSDSSVNDLAKHLTHPQTKLGEIDDVFSTFLNEIDTIVRERDSQESPIINLDKNGESTGKKANLSIWKEVLDPHSKKIYFWNIKTNEVTWEAPMESTELTISEPTFSEKELHRNEEKSGTVEHPIKRPILIGPDHNLGATGDALDVYSEAVLVTSGLATNENAHSPVNVLRKFSNSETILEENPTDTYTPVPTMRIIAIENKIDEFIKQIRFLTQSCDSLNEQSIENFLAIRESPNIDKVVESASSDGNMHKESQSDSSIAEEKVDELLETVVNVVKTVQETESKGKLDLVNEEDELLKDILEVELGEIFSTSDKNEDSLSTKSPESSETGGITSNVEEEHAQIQSFLLDIYQRFSMLSGFVNDNWKIAFKVQLETRISDWMAGELSASYFSQKLSDALGVLTSFQATENFKEKFDQRLSIAQSDGAQADIISNPNQNTLAATPFPVYSSNDYYSFAATQSLCSGIFTLPNFFTVAFPYGVSPEAGSFMQNTSTVQDISSQHVEGEHANFTEISPQVPAHLEISEGDTDTGMNLDISSSTATGDPALCPTVQMIPRIPANTSGNISSGTHLQGNKKRKKAITGSFMHRKKLDLVDRWKKSAKVAEKEEQDENPSANKMEEERLRTEEEQIARWKEAQIVSGAAEKNVNFIPVANDWRTVVEKNLGTK